MQLGAIDADLQALASASPKQPDDDGRWRCSLFRSLKVSRVQKRRCCGLLVDGAVPLSIGIEQGHYKVLRRDEIEEFRIWTQPGGS